MTSNGNNILNCGGHPNLKRCYSLEIKEKRWIHHSNLTQNRVYATSVTMPNGVYIFGGSESPTTTDFLPKNSGVWQAGPSIPNGFKRGCGVQISQEVLLLIGGDDTEERLLEFNTRTNNFTIRGDKLQQGRYDHSCTLLNDTIIVAGGMDAGNNALSSTELVPLTNGSPRFGGDLNMYRGDFGLVTIGNHHKKAYSFGGQETDNYNSLKSVEEWDANTEQWKLATFSLKEAKKLFGYLAVPPQLVCPPNN
jgi:N-acetylneuraminic acid mutarotase